MSGMRENTEQKKTNVRQLNYLFTTVLDGRNASLADGVQRTLGQEPRDFTDYARDAAATGVWGAYKRRATA